MFHKFLAMFLDFTVYKLILQSHFYFCLYFSLVQSQTGKRLHGSLFHFSVHHRITLPPSEPSKQIEGMEIIQCVVMPLYLKSHVLPLVLC